MSIDEASAADFRPEPRRGPVLSTVPDPLPEPDPLPDDLVTRLLSAQVYLREQFADRVNAELIHPTRAALAPLWHVDAVKLARHASAARRFRRSRDVGLAATLGYVLLAGTLVLLLALGQILAVREAFAVWVVLWGWAYVVAVRLVYTQTLAARRSAVAVIYEPEAVQPEPLTKATAEQNLVDLNHSNVVLFRGDSSPFVGSGIKIDHWSLTIDVSKRSASAHNRGAATSADYVERPTAPDQVTGGDLQAFLLESLPDRVEPRPAAGNRLYVRGGSNAMSVPLFRIGPVLPDRIDALNFRRPVTRVADSVVEQYLQEPTEGARTCTYFQHSAWGGQVLVTLFVQAYVSNRTLFVEGLVYALRPLGEQFYSVRGLPTDRRAEASELFKAALSESLPELFAAPKRLAKSYLGGRANARASNLIEAEIIGHRDIDFGALSSLRERVANYALTDQFAAVDERTYFQIFNRRAMECIGQFLESKHVDLSEFNGQAGGIIGSTTANAKSIYAAVMDNGVSATHAGD